MPRKVRVARHISDDFIAKFREVERDAIPHNPVFLRMIVWALLARTKQRSPAEARFLKYFVQTFAVLERENPFILVKFMQNDPEDEVGRALKEVIEAGLQTLIYRKVGRSQHHLPILRLQRELLAQYINQHPYPQQVRQRESWLHEHSGPIWNRLSPLKCMCSYPDSLSGSLQDDLNWSRTPGQVIYLLLADLHQSTPDQIKKLLSHTTRPSR